jgi:hypothetical protein
MLVTHSGWDLHQRIIILCAVVLIVVTRINLARDKERRARRRRRVRVG